MITVCHAMHWISGCTHLEPLLQCGGPDVAIIHVLLAARELAVDGTLEGAMEGQPT